MDIALNGMFRKRGFVMFLIDGTGRHITKRSVDNSMNKFILGALRALGH